MANNRRREGVVVTEQCQYIHRVVKRAAEALVSLVVRSETQCHWGLVHRV
jgi:hypothetical protein